MGKTRVSPYVNRHKLVVAKLLLCHMGAVAQCNHYNPQVCRPQELFHNSHMALGHRQQLIIMKTPIIYALLYEVTATEKELE